MRLKPFFYASAGSISALGLTATAGGFEPPHRDVRFPPVADLRCLSASDDRPTIPEASAKNPATRGAGFRELPESEFQRESLRTTRCEERAGKFVVVFNQNGF
jgi:hypothetical protein